MFKRKLILKESPVSNHTLSADSFWADDYEERFDPSNKSLFKKREVLQKSRVINYSFVRSRYKPFKMPVRRKPAEYN